MIDVTMVLDLPLQQILTMWSSMTIIHFFLDCKLRCIIQGENKLLSAQLQSMIINYYGL